MESYASGSGAELRSELRLGFAPLGGRGEVDGICQVFRRVSVSAGSAPPKILLVHNLQDQPSRGIELPEGKSLILRRHSSSYDSLDRWPEHCVSLQPGNRNSHDIGFVP